MMCQLCGTAPVVRRDALGRDVCNKLAHRAAAPARKNVTKLQRYVRANEHDPKADKGLVQQAKELLKKMAGA